MEGDESGARVDRRVQRGDVAVAEQDLGVATNQVIVEARDDAGAAPAAADADNAADVAIREHRVDISGAVLVAAGEVAVAIEHMRADLHLEAEGLEGLADDVEVDAVVGGAGRIDQADGVTGLKSRRLDRHCLSGEPDAQCRRGHAAEGQKVSSCRHSVLWGQTFRFVRHRVNRACSSFIHWSQPAAVTT